MVVLNVLKMWVFGGSPHPLEANGSLGAETLALQLFIQLFSKYNGNYAKDKCNIAKNLRRIYAKR